MFHVIFYEPRIPANTGNAIRMVACTGCTLHLIEPLGFTFTDSQLQRAGLDYHDLARVEIHKNFAEFIKNTDCTQIYAFTSKAQRRYDTVNYLPNTGLLFGPEPFGLPETLLTHPQVLATLRLPMLPNCRSLNLANVACTVVYEAWRQQNFHGTE